MAWLFEMNMVAVHQLHFFAVDVRQHHQRQQQQDQHHHINAVAAGDYGTMEDDVDGDADTEEE